MYGSVVLEHFRRPRNQRALAEPRLVGEGHNPLCGDRVRIEIRVDGDRVREAAFTANACAICTASASLLTERVAGEPVSSALAVTDADMIAWLEAELPTARVPCATLPRLALHRALAAR